MENEEGNAYVKVRRSESAYDYGVMFDAGSSGTRCYVYKWPKRVGKDVPLVESLWDEVKQEEMSLKVSPGISTFADDLNGLEEKLQPLISFALEKVPAEKHADTMMYLYATAGMRTLTYAAQDLIYSRVTSIFSRSGFAFDPENIGTITGTAEAYYGWVAVNFMSGAFKVDGGAGLGALDLGGASTQITVAVDAASPLPGLLTARFNGREYTLYAQSFLGYGANLFDDKMKAAAAANGGGNAPCLLRGTPAEFANYNNVTLVGGSSYTGCKEAAINGFLLAADSTCYAAGGGGGCAGLTEATCRCTIEGQGRPVIDTSTKFVGMSNFDNILAGNLKVPADGGWPAAAVASTEEFCGLNFTEAQAKLSGTSANYVASTCTTAVQATELMSTAYNLGSNTVAFKKDIGKFEVTWALGAMVSRANLLNAESPQPKLSPIESGAIGFGSAVAFGIVVVGLLVGSKRLFSSGVSYSPVDQGTGAFDEELADGSVYEAM